MLEPTLEPQQDFSGVAVAQGLVRRRGPPGQQVALNFDVLPAENPIRGAADDRPAQRFEPRDRRLARGPDPAPARTPCRRAGAG